MKLNKDMNILIVGLGLLGGSYAQSLKRQGYKVKAITRSRSSVDFALQKGWIDDGTTEVDPQMIGEADFVIIALYPNVFISWIKENQHLFKSGAVITDVTGVKECIVYEIQGFLRQDVEFIAAHPMAGREVCGVQNSDEAIFRGANYIVVPSEDNSEDAIELCEDLGWKLGFADVSKLSPARHDEMIAFLSQLTHCIAVSLMCANDTPGLERYTGDSFRDLTRIARINDEMWSELFLLNRETLLQEMDRFRTEFDRLYECIRDNKRDEMRDMMRLSTERRAYFDKKK
ncbi:MAG: prephenate dehydrogenase [Ruminococcaceae bacterium]|nr:prephenate dehydrogenase [Oscillospiraceae bacterium]